ncbi:TetR/AcrR family transcriptional regulator [Desulfurivibrio sp. C05AmB]|uniref:TetR/AcrR family transcriptional regulator n=1 Tax=Desulfurivibrio sp. C05AmB TaxID=3374371 RepID=UPI00376F0A4E
MAREKELQDKRRRIMAVALGLLAERGFHGAPIAAIAKEAGIGVGTIYRYFKDKDSLIHAIFRELHDRYQQQLLAEFDPDRPLPKRFSQIFSFLLRMFITAPAEFRFMELYYYSPYATASAARLPAEEGLILQTLQEAREQGLCKNVPMQALEAMAWGPVVALAKEHSNRHLAVNDEIIAQTVRASWDAIRNS